MSEQLSLQQQSDRFTISQMPDDKKKWLADLIGKLFPLIDEIHKLIDEIRQIETTPGIEKRKLTALIVEKYCPLISSLRESLDAIGELAKAHPVLHSIVTDGPSGNLTIFHRFPVEWKKYENERHNLAREALAWLKNEAEMNRDQPIPPCYLRWKGELIQFAPRPWALLKALWGHSSREKTTVIEEAWPYDSSASNSSIKASLSRMNKSLEDAGVPWHYSLKGNYFYKS